MVGIRFSSKKEKLRRLPFFKRNFYVFYLFLLIEKTITQYHIHSNIHSKNASITFQFSWFCPIFRIKKSSFYSYFLAMFWIPCKTVDISSGSRDRSPFFNISFKKVEFISLVTIYKKNYYFLQRNFGEKLIKKCKFFMQLIFFWILNM